MRRFIIQGFGYRHNSAGVRVLHRLCHMLRSCGYDAAIETSALNPEWQAVSGDHSQFDPLTDVAIYPEIQAGNPWGFKNVIRYALNHPGWTGAEKVYPLSEYVMAHSKSIYQSVDPSNRFGGILNISIIEPHLFYFDKQIPRDIELFWVYKGAATRAKYKIPGEESMKEITHEWPASRPATAEILRRCKRFYSYDPFSAITTEAEICGAEVYMIQSDGEIKRHHADREDIINARDKWDDKDQIYTMVDKAFYKFQI
jgi:O-antigen biosynthesis protein